ncbi:MAG: pitrilysin family protein [Candidatus Poribacteria bacterium]|nr:pitrilysin family protein [Candidatus Poribacteria bacterium]
MMRFHHTTLDNGLNIVGEQNPAAQSMAAGYFVRTGARDETDEINGVSHFLKHMMFKGTDRRSAEDVNREMDELGARFNAFTSTEDTVYYGWVLPEFQPRILDLLTDMMRPSLRDDDFNIEKNVILEEIARYDDIPPAVGYFEARRRYYGGHPLGNNVLGSPESIKALTRDQMMEYFERRYAPNNLTLTLTGNFDFDAAVEQVATMTQGWGSFETPRDTASPTKASDTHILKNEKFTRAHLIFFAPGPSTQDDSRYAAQVLASAVGDDVGSRLYWALVDPGLVDEASLSHDSEDHAGQYEVYASCAPGQAQEVADTVRGILADVTQNGIADDEIDRSKQKIASGLVLGAETPMGRLNAVGRAWTYRREYVDLDTVTNRLLAVDAAAVDAVLKAYPLDRTFLLGLGPLGALR